MAIATVALPGGPSFRVAIDSLGGLDPVAEDMARGTCSLFVDSWPLLRSLLRPTSLTVLDLRRPPELFRDRGRRARLSRAGRRSKPGECGAFLRRSAELNGPVDVRVVHAAVSDRAGDVLFRQRGPWGWVVQEEIRGDPNVQRVRSAAVDELLFEHDVLTVDLVKMDIEGSEVAGVSGMTELLAQPQPPVVFYESNGYTLDVFGETCQRLKAAFSQFGFQSYYVDSSRVTRTIEPDDMQPDCVADYLAVKSSARALWFRGRQRTIGAWPVARRLGRAEWLGWLRSACGRAASVEERSHLVRELARAPAWARDDPVASEFVLEARKGGLVGH